MFIFLSSVLLKLNKLVIYYVGTMFPNLEMDLVSANISLLSAYRLYITYIKLY